MILLTDATSTTSKLLTIYCSSTKELIGMDNPEDAKEDQSMVNMCGGHLNHELRMLAVHSKRPLDR